MKAYIDAIGGKDAIAAITSSRYKGVLEMMMGKMSIDVATMAPNKLHLVQTVPGMGGQGEMKVETGCDGTIGWNTNPMTGEAELVEPAMLEAMREGSDFQALVRSLDKSFSGFTTTGEETFDGVACWTVSMKAKTGEASTALFDKSTKLIRGIRQESHTPQGDESAAVVFADWKDYPVGTAKIKVFHGISISQSGMKVTGTFSDFAFNNVEASYFDAPAKVKDAAKAKAEAAKPATGAPAAPATPAGEAPKAAPAGEAPKAAPPAAPAK